MIWLAGADNTAWLLIIDNVDRDHISTTPDPDAYDVKQYLCGADHGCILITTRLAKLEQIGDGHQLRRTEEDQAREIFESWYKRSSGKHNIYL